VAVSFTAAQIAELVGGEVIGDPAKTVSGVSDLRTAGPEHISFLGNDRYLPAVRETGAGIVLLARDAPSDFSFTQIRVDSPNFSFVKVVDVFMPKVPSFPPGVHPSAVVDPAAQLGEGVSIQPHAVIEAGVRIGARTVVGANGYVGHESVIGEDCVIYPNCSLRERTILGCRVILHSGVVIGGDGFGFELRQGRHEKIPQLGYVQIDDDVEVGANTTIDRGRFGPTWIQEGTKIDNLVQIAHNCRVGKHCLIVSGTGLSGSTTLGNYVTLAGHVGTVGHITIGDNAIITGLSGVSKDVPAGAVMSGRRAMPMREELKLEALASRLPELFERVKKIEKLLDPPVKL
jgi:UDP-3-O-[3-hydroxymyristoyl] glucosamine N-acyltransferase